MTDPYESLVGGTTYESFERWALGHRWLNVKTVPGSSGTTFWWLTPAGVCIKVHVNQEHNVTHFS